MDPARIAELLGPYLDPRHSEFDRRGDDDPALLSPAQLRDISIYIDLLLRWNSRINLTAIRNEEEVVTRHFGESLFAASHLFPRLPGAPSVVENLGLVADSGPEHGRPTPRAADLGSGAGFPGIPIRLWAPEIHLTLIESNHKKSAFLGEVIRTLRLTGIDIKSDRAESVADTYDLVTLRAVERFTSILPVAASLTKSGGQVALLIASSQIENARCTLPFLKWRSPINMPASRSHVLLLGTK